ncbi:MAG: nuclear transport factor 2 family protein [Deltaproteobacteria bacterium]|nr:nuclear transport factor 2 family protein [Deltaproteobacteria bacterium]
MLATHDIVAIQQLTARYGHLVDAREWKQLGEIFTSDGVFDVTAFNAGRHEGLAAVIAFFERAAHPAAHHATNLYVYEEGTIVRALSKYAVPSEGGKLFGGDYRDTLMRTANGWRIKERVVTTRWPARP